MTGVSLGSTLLLFANIRQGCKSLEGKNALTFLVAASAKKKNDSNVVTRSSIPLEVAPVLDLPLSWCLSQKNFLLRHLLDS
jgi:hypothetical protein